MPVNCGVCGDMCEEDKSSIKCAGGCEGAFHIKCVKYEGMKTRQGGVNNWKCETCAPEKDASSAGSSKSTDTIITKEFFLSTLESFKKEVLSEMKNYGSQMEDFRKAVQFLSDKVDESNSLIASIRKEYVEIKKENEDIRRENKLLNESVATLQEKVRSMEQYSRRTNLEISGVPETGGEDVLCLLRDVGTAVGVELQESQVMAAHRIPSYKKDRPPAIIVQFQTKTQRDAWILKFKQKEQLTANEIHPSFPKKRVYLNEHLAPDNKVFLAQLKDKCREMGIKYAWFRDGKFYVRKSDGERCYKMNSIQGLDRLYVK